MSGELVPVEEIKPGLVAAGFSEEVLARSESIDDPRTLWDAAAALSGLARKWNGHGAEQREVKAAQMFCEVRLGQLLGPNPGQGVRTIDHFPRADSDLPPQRVKDFRRFHGHLDLLVEAIRDGKLSRRALLLLIDQHEAGQRPDPIPDELEIRRGDFRTVLEDLDRGSVALVLTDPPYPIEYLALWSDLGKHAAQWLPPGGSLIAYSGQANLPQTIQRLDEHLRYWWTLALLQKHGNQMILGKGVACGWKPLLWFVQEHRSSSTTIVDRITGSPPRKTVPTGDGGDWAQGVEELEPIISALTAPGDLIVDPMAGSGTVGIAAARFGRRYIGAELAAGVS